MSKGRTPRRGISANLTPGAGGRASAASTSRASTNAAGADAVAEQRRLLADLCHVLGAHARGAAPAANGKAATNGDGAAKPRRADGTPVVQRPAPESDRNGHLALPPLSPRVRQTLDRLLKGDSEKQVAVHLNVSRHTVHIYVKQLYRRLNVSSRGELLARFVRPASD